MVTILLGDGFEEAEALVPADLLRRAGVDVTLVGLDGLRVTGGHGITVCADRSLEELDPDGVEMLLLPGGMGGVECRAHHSGPSGHSGPPPGGVLPRHGGGDGLRRGTEGRPGRGGRTHHHRRGRRFRL